ncbi:DAL5 [Candida jiufengensis]|uniref:DAL5 n=1 Tax=Candida jiufengensis TaxID=497108 RepID=UPI0022257C83|nr:DAL5 [Candida jiufengensis]KAI5956865.1 DAL5 [Candida jiufengensis]
MSSEKEDQQTSLEPVLSFSKDDLEDKNLHVLTTIISPNGKEVQITNNVDQAMKYALEHQNDGFELDEATNKRILRKIDTFLLPVMCLLYCFQFMDKLSTSYSSILGLREELHMVGDMYSWTSTSFYLGYLVFEFPASMLLQRFPVAKTVSVFIIIWGMILALCSVPKYPGFIALRTILGMLESAVTPAFTIITSQWYKRDEQFLRTAWWFASNGIGTIVGSGIAYGLYIHQESYSLPAWKLVFVVTGVLTIFLGFVIATHIPDAPTKAWFLTEEEKVLVVERIRSNQQGFGNRRFKKNQFIEALTDHRTWLFFLYSLSSNIPNGGITSFGTILLNEQFGFTKSKSLLMQMPQGAVEIVGCTLFAYFAKFVKSRMLVAIGTTAVVVMAECLLAFAPSNQGKLAGLYLYTLGPIGFICLISQIASSVAGHTKKITVNAIYLIAYCVGNLIGPQTFIATQAPDYNGAKIAIVICGIISLLCLIAIYISYILENKRRDNLPPVDMSHIENYEFADLTDKENPNFRYAL